MIALLKNLSLTYRQPQRKIKAFSNFLQKNKIVYFWHDFYLQFGHIKNQNKNQTSRRNIERGGTATGNFKVNFI